MYSSLNRTITYSPAYTLVPTYECFNRCTYCNFRVDVGQDSGLALEEAELKLRSLQTLEISEILILSGEVHPQSPQRSDWFQRIYQLCKLALSHSFLPHTNAGLLTFEEMAQLQQVNASLGLMLEQLTPRLLTTVHCNAPSKVPALRLQQLAWAGKLGIPFTTGLLLGIGEDWHDRCQTLQTIAQMHDTWKNIQEVILQPYRVGSSQISTAKSLQPEEIIEIVKVARQILPDSITIQIPPNLIQTPEVLLACLAAGARDLGGIVPKDEVNPDYKHQSLEAIDALLNQAGWNLTPRLPVYPQYVSLLPEQIQETAQFQQCIKQCKIFETAATKRLRPNSLTSIALNT